MIYQDLRLKWEKEIEVLRNQRNSSIDEAERTIILQQMTRLELCCLDLSFIIDYERKSLKTDMDDVLTTKNYYKQEDYLIKDVGEVEL